MRIERSGSAAFFSCSEVRAELPGAISNLIFGVLLPIIADLPGSITICETSRTLFQLINLPWFVC
jgi:hypothetical protein